MKYIHQLSQKYLYALAHHNGISLQCFYTVGWRQEGHPACKKLDVGLLVAMM